MVEAVFVTYRPQPMYNFSVAAAHTYFVGDARWLVHNACQLYDIVRYRDPAPGFHKHHGVLDVWARHNIQSYSKGAAPAIALTEAQHYQTFGVLNRWRASRGGSVDWSTVTAREANQLAWEMFEAAGVPVEARQRYFQAFYKYLYEELP